jgi:hypothetical protein
MAGEDASAVRHRHRVVARCGNLHATERQRAGRRSGYSRAIEGPFVPLAKTE